jgi:protein O-mannosyl-transferase
MAAVTVAAYLPALRAGFVWDDDAYVTKPALQGLRGLWRIWTELGATEQYYPLLHGTFWLEHRLWGDVPFAYHLVNILLHATAAWLLVLVLRRLRSIEPNSPDRYQVSGFKFQHSAFDFPLFTGLLFALHPVCVESVAWISEQKNTESTVFYLLAALLYLRFVEERRPGAYAAALGCFACALLSKTVSATLPAALLLVLWWRKGTLSVREDIRPLAPWLALGAFAGLFSGWVERTYIGAKGADFSMGLADRLVLSGRVPWFYLGKLLWPARLVFTYPRWHIDATHGTQWLPLAAALLLVGVLLALGRRGRAPLVAVLFFAGSLLPTIGFFNVYAFYFSYVADHWQYLACPGILALAADAWETWDRGWRPGAPGGSGWPVPRICAIALLGVLGLLTFRQCGAYRDKETLYLRTIAANPGAWMARNNLADLYYVAGRTEEAIPQYLEALRLKPDLPEAHNNLGLALIKRGRLAEATDHFREAIRLNPAYSEPYENLGVALLALGRPAEALGLFSKVLELSPGYAAVHFNRGNALAALGRLPEAVDSYREAIRLRPVYAAARANLGLALAQSGRPDLALPELEQAVREDPTNATAREILAALREALGRNAAATPGSP